MLLALSLGQEAAPAVQQAACRSRVQRRVKLRWRDAKPVQPHPKAQAHRRAFRAMCPASSRIPPRQLDSQLCSAG